MLDAGADTEAVSSKGETPRQLAHIRGQHDLVGLTRSRHNCGEECGEVVFC